MTGTRWLTDDEQRAWRAYLRMNARLLAALSRQLQTDSGISGADYGVLVQLSEAPGGRLRPYEIQHALDWEQSRLSHHLGRMQRRGLVARRECCDDGRGAFIELTETGRQAITAAAPGHVDTVRRYFFDQLSPDEVATLEAMASRVLKGLDTPPR
jgi:DNA-binding MarR family transcriptional regulator